MTDPLIEQIADYALSNQSFSEEAYKTATLCLVDAIGCGFLALNYDECNKLLGPIIEGTQVPNGCHIFGTPHILDPVNASFNIGTMIRWLDYNDTWLAAEWGHPSDNLGALIPICDYLAKQGKKLTVYDLLTAMIKAYEIQGIIALENSFNQIGFDHIILVKVASTAISAQLLGANRQQLINAVSNAWVDVGPLRTYRHAPNTGSRKSWAAGDAASRAVWLAWIAMKNEMGYPNALTAKNWGLYDVLFDGAPFMLPQPFNCYVMENILFKISYPAEFHAQTAVEAAIQLHRQVGNKLNEIESIHIETHQSAVRIIDKKGPLTNPADRDHCLQYMVAIALMKGDLTADDYSDRAAKNPKIDQLRNKMIVTENPLYSRDYLDPKKRSIANRLTIQMKNEKVVGPLLVEYPLGHRKRREEGVPLLLKKLKKNISTRMDKKRATELFNFLTNFDALPNRSIHDFINRLGSGNCS